MDKFSISSLFSTKIMNENCSLPFICSMIFSSCFFFFLELLYWDHPKLKSWIRHCASQKIIESDNNIKERMKKFKHRRGH